MKKVMTTVLATVLMLTMLLGLVGCNSGGIVGKWACEVDASKILGYTVGVSLSSLRGRMIFDFKDDGTVTMDLDKAHFEQQLPALVDELAAMLAQQKGISVQELYVNQGLTREQLIQQVRTNMYTSSTTLSLQYFIEGDQIWMTANAQEKGDPMTFKIEGNTMYFTATNVTDVPEALRDMMPLTFTRI